MSQIWWFPFILLVSPSTQKKLSKDSVWCKHHPMSLARISISIQSSLGELAISWWFDQTWQPNKFIRVSYRNQKRKRSEHVVNLGCRIYAAKQEHGIQSQLGVLGWNVMLHALNQVHQTHSNWTFKNDTLVSSTCLPANPPRSYVY